MNPKRSADSARKLEQLLRDRAQQFPNESCEQSFSIVANSAAGAQLIAAMKRAEQPKAFVNVPTETDPDAPTKPGEKYDPQGEAAARQAFVDLTEQRALGDLRGTDRAMIWASTSNSHPEGRRLYRIWKRNSLLKKREDLAKEQAQRGPSALRTV